MPKERVLRFRVSSEEAKMLYAAAGGERKFSAWARNLLNLAVGPRAVREPEEPKPPKSADAVRKVQALAPKPAVPILAPDRPKEMTDVERAFARIKPQRIDYSKSQLKKK